MYFLFCTGIGRCINLLTFAPPETLQLHHCGKKLKMKFEVFTVVKFKIAICTMRTCSLVTKISHLSSVCNMTKLYVA
jgi:hypothetical protein